MVNILVSGGIIISVLCSTFLKKSAYLLFPVSIAKHLESANTMFSFIWWIIGFYWVSAGGQTLTRYAPQLYWFVKSYLFSVVWTWFFCSCLVDVICYYMYFVLQALYSFSGIWRVLCRILHRPGMCCWYCSLLLSAMYHCNFICSRRSGISPWWLVWAPLVSYHYILSCSYPVTIDIWWDCEM